MKNSPQSTPRISSGESVKRSSGMPRISGLQALVGTLIFAAAGCGRPAKCFAPDQAIPLQFKLARGMDREFDVRIALQQLDGECWQLPMDIDVEGNGVAYAGNDPNKLRLVQREPLANAVFSTAPESQDLHVVTPERITVLTSLQGRGTDAKGETFITPPLAVRDTLPLESGSLDGGM